MPVPSERELHARTLLRDDVYISLRDAIVRGELLPGEQLRDVELSAWLGVSRTPIREALLRLARAGLVVSTPGRLTAVAPEDPQRVCWAQQIVSELHALATRVAVGKMADADYAEMLEANVRLGVAIADGDAGEAIRADDAFHAVPVRVAGNPLIAEQLEGVAPMLHRAEYLHFGATPGRLSPERHERIVAAMRAGDAEAAADLARRNWESLGE
ncbi:GntR family transcriptional regulator [Leucobacter sp. BZR 635]